ncbi:MAG TPA: type VI secretion system tip protein VgrG [Gammaproteobacteria bacterium]|nr:type VI secretion system tip protein VgrG [Gammaproteobacteria bacterium]
MSGASEPTSQTGRLIGLQTVLGGDILIPTHISGSEDMSALFHYSLDVFSDTKDNLQPKDLVGTPATFVLQQTDKSLRYFNGYIDSMVALGVQRAGQQTTYSLTMMPWLGFLEKASNCRIFQNKTIPDILTDVFTPYSMSDVKKKLTATHPEHAFIVQYNETDLEFVEHLMRREGIAYYFTHTNGTHTLNLVDAGISLPKLTPKDKLFLQSGTNTFEHFDSWEHASEFVTGKFRQKAYNYKNPSDQLKVKSQAKGETGKVPRVLDMEHYRYNVDFGTASAGNPDTALRRDEELERERQVRGSGHYRFLQVGHVFTADVIPATASWDDKGKSFSITGVEWSAWDSSHSSDGDAGFSMSFTAMPKGALTFPFARTEPRIYGMQTAVVNGPPGSEIHTDSLGRICVKFHWDERPKTFNNGNTSCWLRVMQSMSGKGFGGQFTPRVGQEVVIAFEEGNPNRPFVIGGLYHGEHAPPYVDGNTLGPGTRSGMKTRSTQGGGASNYNELYFEDKKGSEQVFIQAEKDLDIKVKNNEKHKIKKDLGYTVGNNENHKVSKEVVIDAGQKITLKVGGSTVTITASSIDIKSPTVNIN